MWSSLRVRLTVIFIGLAIGPLLLVGMILIQQSFAFEREQALELQSQVAQRVSTETASFFGEVENDLRLLSGEFRGEEQLDRAQLLNLLLSKFSAGPFRTVYREFALLDGQGQEQLRLSRQKTYTPDDLDNRAGAAEFERPIANRKTYFSPVRFDVATGAPFITIAIPLFGPRSVRPEGVLVANLDFGAVEHLLVDFQTSKDQTIYVIDAENRVVAHQTIPVNRTLRFEAPAQAGIQAGLTGADVVLVDDTLQLGDQQFTIIVERPAADALAQANNTMVAILVTIMVALVIAGGVGLFMARQIVGPVETMANTARAISDGDLSQSVAITSYDELNTLANAFNIMTAQLRALIDTLEDRIHHRTRALETSAQISRQLTSILDLGQLLQYVVSRIRDEFDFYHTHIYLVEEESGDLIMVEGSGQVGRRLKAQGHRLQAGQGIVGRAAETNNYFFSNNVSEVLNFVRNPLLPDTNSELAVPLRKGEQVLGVLDIQSEQLDRFTLEDISLMQSLADQTAVAIDNSRLLTRTQAALQEVERLNQRLVHEAWEQFRAESPALGYRFEQGQSQEITTDSDRWSTLMEQALTEKQLVKQIRAGDNGPGLGELAVPLILRGEVIGVLNVKREETPDWIDEEVTAVEAVANQITLALENARLSKEQEKTIVQLQDIDRLKSEFLTSMSHELRTPLNSILGFADVLLQGIDGELNELAMHDIQLIYNSGQHLLALINDILDLSKIEAGKVELVCEPVAVRPVVDDVLASVHALLKSKPVEIIVNVSEALPPIYADKLRLNQILLNLVSNAAKFTDAGRINIVAKVAADKPDQMFISVSDTGIGILEDKFEAIFDRFSQADSSTSRKYGGTGLGLPICQQLVTMHGGTIGLSSKIGVGSTFYFTIPLADEKIVAGART